MAGRFEALKAEADHRWLSLSQGDVPWIRVGTALCGKAAGADQVIAGLKTELKGHNIEAAIHEVGCMGLCFAEPLVDITMTNGTRLFYGNVVPSEVPAIVYSHLVRGLPLTDLAFGYLGAEGLDGVQDLSEHPMMKDQVRIALRNAGTLEPTDIHQYIANGGYGALNKALTQMNPEETLEER